MSNKFTDNGGFYGDFETWVLDEDIQEKLFRVKNIPENNGNKYGFYYFTTIINLDDGKFLIGLQEGDRNNLYYRGEAIFYYRLSSLEFSYYEEDQE